MKSIEELQEIFSIFDGSKERFLEILKGPNWKISVFKPFERNGIAIFSFRLYGEISGSKFAKYNESFQWCGGVDYLYNLTTKELERKEYEQNLHDMIERKINVNDLLKEI